MERFRFDSLARSFDYVWISILSPSWPDKKRPTTRRISGSRVYKIPKFRSPLHREFLAERDAILRLRFRSGAHRRETETRRNTTAGIFEIQRRLVAFFFFFSFFFSLSFSFVRLCTTYKKEKKNVVSTIPPKVFRAKYFSRHGLDAWVSSPVVWKGFSSRGQTRNGGTGRHSVQVHPTDLNSWPEWVPLILHANVNIPSPRVVLMPSDALSAYISQYLFVHCPFDYTSFSLEIFQRFRWNYINR